MPKKVQGNIDTSQSQMPAAHDYISCGSCGQSIGKAQGYTPVYNTRFGNYEYYHDSYRGCADATHIRNSRPRVVLNRYGRGIIHDILFGDSDNGLATDLSDNSQE
jgi:hypothetical protein